MDIVKLEWKEGFEISKRVIKQVVSEKPQNAILIGTQSLKTDNVIIGDTFLYQEQQVTQMFYIRKQLKTS